eukprot:4993641-Amphidinium_carterae.1
MKFLEKEREGHPCPEKLSGVRGERFEQRAVQCDRAASSFSGRVESRTDSLKMDHVHTTNKNTQREFQGTATICNTTQALFGYNTLTPLSCTASTSCARQEATNTCPPQGSNFLISP